MAARKRLTIEQWIIEAMSDADKGAPCTGIALVHVKGMGGAQEEVHFKPLTGATHDPKKLADFFTSRATGFAQDIAGLQSFRLLAFYGESKEPANAHTFTVADGDLAPNDASQWSKHEASPQGMLAQLMKHNEHIMGTMNALVQGFASSLLRDNENLRRENAEATAIVRDVLFNMKEADHKMRMEQLAYSRASAEREMIARALPAVVNHLTGKEVIPQSHADSELLDSLALKVKPEMLQQLVAVGIVSAEEAALLSARFAQTLERKKKEIEEVRQLPPEGT